LEEKPHNPKAGLNFRVSLPEPVVSCSPLGHFLEKRREFVSNFQKSA
jgi:hypothetical protein